MTQLFELDLKRMPIESVTLALSHLLRCQRRPQFGERAGMPPLKLTWYEGSRPPRPEELEDVRKLPDEGGVLF